MKCRVVLTERRWSAATTVKASGLDPNRQEKPLARAGASVPQTDTGGPVEDTQVDGRPPVKELGNMPP